MLDEGVNFPCLIEKGKPLLDDDDELEVNTNLSCVLTRIMGDFAKEELDQRENLFHAGSKIQDKLQWLNESRKIKSLRQASIWYSVGKYNDELVSDVVPMLACHILLGRPWQFDRDVVHQERSNKYTFVIEGKKYMLSSLTPYQVSEDYWAIKELREMIRVEEEKGDGKSSTIIAKEGSCLDKNKKKIDMMIYFKKRCLQDYPPLRGTEHQIDFVSGSQIPNRPAYRINLEETKELQRQVEEILEKELIKESLSSCAILVILVAKKNVTWRMCTDCKAINKITAKYQHLITRLDDMLDELCGSIVFSKIDLRSGSNRIEVDEEKEESIKTWPIPTNATEETFDNLSQGKKVDRFQLVDLFFFKDGRVCVP
ncbi:uncharacterized protein LOC129899863 [Solanum dulcamara]|uniref:uncharacterized protein LOC129899863 n=1 Tax=Solanum dulcamara TaxID=45834 RepID=UPI0024866ED7|nr:uncharacterized protein LOC129899863 [Solanum dulcamara]